MKSKSQIWSITLVGDIIVTLGLFAVIMCWLDPLLHYGKESKPLTYYKYNTLYSNPGIARYYDYDSVMVGTSMIQNTNVDLCDELFQCKMVRLPYSGGTTFNMKTILNICFNSHNDIKTVYWELDEFQLMGNAFEPRYPLPEYLYRNDHVSDLSYLLNLDIFYHYTINDIIGTLQKKVEPAERRGITLHGDFGRENMLLQYTRPEKNEVKTKFEDNVKNKVDANLENIITILEENPDTEFVFFMPPFSILYWDREMQHGTFDSTIEALQYAIENLLDYNNIKIFFYQFEKDIITNLDNYKDYSHYGYWINDTITEYISNNRNLMDKTNYKQMILDMKEYIETYNYDEILN